MLILETERLLLRELIPQDADALQSVLGDPDVMRFGSGALSPAEIADWIAAQIAGYRAHGCGLWAVVDRARESAIGYCGLTHFPDLCGRPEVEIGYRLARSAWGRGFATEAATAARDYAWHTLGLERLVSLIDPGNSRSIRVAEKLGMRLERSVMLDGYDHPDHIYAVHSPRSMFHGKVGT